MKILPVATIPIIWFLASSAFSFVNSVAENKSVTLPKIIEDIPKVTLSLLNNKKETNVTAPKRNIYDAVKKKFVKIISKPNPNEHGRWSGFRRAILRFILHLFGIALAPVKETAAIAEKVGLIPETSGLDTNNSFFHGAILSFKAKVQGIYPGTKWCGKGNVAESQNDLGAFSGSDNCCKDHDNCLDFILPGKVRFGLKNNGLFRRSSCKCDGDFYNCLKRVKSPASDQVGYTYFTILGPQCFLKVDCSQQNVTCRTGLKQGFEYQWSDNPQY
ncbi:uncharacterized protein LOC132703264 [Cylas formicarius]|uniref:uncharacterized protein LOC132703264 n=1 Tax=Cylas formicarius TaxID=197179 RepID=UPI0029586CC9|nr:uncharacterized protein LOC132703264 [Cylas formicarius]XP_060528407.1 uncharacterized protein LOC132703264 [Cylas formicarius]XP_060528415.1 uncharacterized protein LOC132703264 [Cylas formicarius]